MKKFLVILAMLFLALPVSAEMLLTGEVQYTADKAREELLNKIPSKLDSKIVRKFAVDKEYDNNTSALLNGHAELKDRTLALFSDNSYAVMYKENESRVWYYSQNGKLTHYEIKDGLEYPYKTYKYNTYGELVNMGLRVSKAETFIFSPNGRLIAHWIKSNGYDETGRLIMRRKYLE